MNKPITATAVEKMRRWAKQHARETSLPYGLALERAARDAGFENWHEVTQAVKAVAPFAGVVDLPVDPPLPAAFDDTPNENRSKAELDAWWLRPFAQSRPDGSLDVRCLDGGAWDRPTYYGTASEQGEALELARTKLKAWQEIRDTPVVFLAGESVCLLVLEPNRPGMPRPVLLAVGSREDLPVVLARWRETCERDAQAARLAVQAARERSAKVPTYPEVERAQERAVGAVTFGDGTAAGMQEIAVLLALVHFAGPSRGDVQFTLPELAQYLWEFRIDEANVDAVFARARQLLFEGHPIIGEASQVRRDGLAHWTVGIAASRWLTGRKR